MSCLEVKTKKYQTRKSPAFHAKDCKNLTKQGKDGEYLSKPDSKGVYKWVKVSTGSPLTGSLVTKTRKVKKGIKEYFINDNGNKPFKVEVSGKNVEIYSGKQIDDGSDDYDEHRNYNELIKKLKVLDVYPGESPCQLAIVSGFDCGKNTLGNSVLLHVDTDRCMFIGKEIYEFTLEDEIEAYYSAIRLNSVSYPILLGTKYVYLMLDHIYIPRDIFKAKMNDTEWADAYSYYYGMKNLETGEKMNTHTKVKKSLVKKMNGFTLVNMYRN